MKTISLDRITVALLALVLGLVLGYRGAVGRVKECYAADTPERQQRACPAWLATR